MATKPLSPSQIAKLQEMHSASLRKANPFSDEAQYLIENSWEEYRAEVEEACVAAINRILERKRNTIIVEVEVDYDRPPQGMIEALDRRQYVDGDVVDQIPRRRQGKQRVKVEFFKLGHSASDEEAAQERTARNLVRDEYAQAAVNEKDKAFADEHPNSVSWQDANGKWCYIACFRFGVVRFVRVFRFGFDWCGFWWFAGVRKESLES